MLALPHAHLCPSSNTRLKMALYHWASRKQALVAVGSRCKPVNQTDTGNGIFCLSAQQPAALTAGEGLGRGPISGPLIV